MWVGIILSRLIGSFYDGAALVFQFLMNYSVRFNYVDIYGYECAYKISKR